VCWPELAAAQLHADQPGPQIPRYIFDWDLYQQDALRDGVVAAAHFNIFHHHTDRVKQSSIAQTMNVLQAMIQTDGPKMVLTSTYCAFKMDVPFQDASA
jgi:alpha-N-arabinofuranosidase